MEILDGMRKKIKEEDAETLKLQQEAKELGISTSEASSLAEIEAMVKAKKAEKAKPKTEAEKLEATRKEALEHFDKALELGQNDAWIFEMRGTILLDFKRYEEALDSFKKAYDLNDDSWYLYSIGRCLRGLERYEEAIEILLKSRQISLDEEDVVDGEDFELAYCYIGIGDKENAQKYLDSARDAIIERGILNDYFKEKIEEIEKGILSLNN